MSPSFAALYARDGIGRDAIFCGDIGLQSVVCANSQHVGLAQFGGGASGAAIRCAMVNAVSLICRACVPSQIFEAVVRRIAVVVAALHSFRGRPNEGKHDGAVNSHHLGLVVLPQKRSASTAAGILKNLLQGARIGTPDLAEVRDFIEPFKARNSAPDFLMLHVKCPLPGFGHYSGFPA